MIETRSQRIKGVKLSRRGIVKVVAADPVYAVLGNGGTIARNITGYAERKPQLDLAQFVTMCIQAREHGLGEAGTGVGKSYAYLVAALLSDAPQIIVAVPTIALQDQLILKDLPNLARPGVMPRRFTYALLKGRRNYACRLKADQFIAEPRFERPEDALVLPDVAAWYQDTTDGDLGKLKIQLPMSIRSEITADSDECLGESCPKFGGCFGELAKMAAKSATVVVTNYAMLMLNSKLRMQTGGLISLLPESPVLVLDECHQLPDKARDAFTVEFTPGRWDRLAKRIRRLIGRVCSDEAVQLADGTIRDLSDIWGDRVDVCDALMTALTEGYTERVRSSEDDAIRLGDEIEYMHDALVALYRLNVNMLEDAPMNLEGTDRKMWDKASDSLAELIGDLCNIAAPRERLDYVRLAELEGEAEKLILSFVPVDVAPILRDNLYAGKTTISVSATITENGGSLGYYREQVGLDECREIVAGSPFNYQRDTILYVPEDAAKFNPSTARQDQDDWKAYLNRMADECVRLVNASRGRAFLLFTSRKVMDEVYSRMARRNEYPGVLPYPLLRQGDAPMAQMVETFKATPSVLFGLKTYWEGVSIDGEALSLVVIAAIPFTPPTDPVQKARCEVAQQRYGRGAHFRNILIPEATIALKQGFGRGKRTETDRAVIAILDGRLRTANYGNGIIGSLPDSPLTGDYSRVREFFKQ